MEGMDVPSFAFDTNARLRRLSRPLNAVLDSGPTRAVDSMSMEERLAGEKRLDGMLPAAQGRACQGCRQVLARKDPLRIFSLTWDGRVADYLEGLQADQVAERAGELGGYGGVHQ
jgi:hypothetical protein